MKENIPLWFWSLKNNWKKSLPGEFNHFLLKVYGLKQPGTSNLERWTWNQHMWPWIQSLSLSLLKSHYLLTLGFAHCCVWKQYLLQTYCCEKKLENHVKTSINRYPKCVNFLARDIIFLTKATDILSTQSSN